MRKQILLSGAAAIAVSAFSVPAFAADPMPIVVAPTTVAAYVEQPRTWTGGYVGGNAALLRGRVNDDAVCFVEDGEETYAWVTTFLGALPADDDCEELFLGNAGAGSINNNQGFSVDLGPLEVSPLTLAGYSIGGQIGYLRQLGNGPNGFVIGGEVSANYASVDGLLFAFPEQGDPGDGFLGVYSVNAYATATLRAGFAFGPALIYAEGGLAIASLTYTDNIGFNGGDIAHGYVYGGGIEGRISEHVTLFFEYNRIHINDVFMMSTEGPADFLTTFMFTNVDLNVFKTGFNIQFGGDH